MRKFRFNKLVRDKIVDGMRSVGGKPNHRVLNNEEFKIELIRKIQEEAKEFELQPNDDIVELLADVQEVLDTLSKSHKPWSIRFGSWIFKLILSPNAFPI